VATLGFSAVVTHLRDTLIYVKSHRNVTLSLPEPLLRRFRVYAAARNESMTSVAAEAIRALIERDEQTAAANRRLIERMRNAPDRGTGGKISWSRDEMHER
jgi:hypothetical protein